MQMNDAGTSFQQIYGDQSIANYYTKWFKQIGFVVDAIKQVPSSIPGKPAFVVSWRNPTPAPRTAPPTATTTLPGNMYSPTIAAMTDANARAAAMAFRYPSQKATPPVLPGFSTSVAAQIIPVRKR